jgi:hypothetical protein
MWDGESDGALDDIRSEYRRLEEAYEAILVVQEELDKALLNKDGAAVEASLKELREWWGEIECAEGNFGKDVNTLMKDVIDEEHYNRIYSREFIPTTKFVTS